MTTITARLAKWWAWAATFIVALVGLLAGLLLYLLRSKRGEEVASSVVDEQLDRWREAQAKHDVAIAIIKAKDQAAKQELQEIKREPEWHKRMEKMRELKERVMGEGKS